MASTPFELKREALQKHFPDSELTDRDVNCYGAGYRDGKLAASEEAVMVKVKAIVDGSEQKLSSEELLIALRKLVSLSIHGGTK